MGLMVLHGVEGHVLDLWTTQTPQGFVPRVLLPPPSRIRACVEHMKHAHPSEVDRVGSKLCRMVFKGMLRTFGPCTTLTRSICAVV